MRQISLREFRTRGAKALSIVPQGETILLSGQDGPAYFLLPMLGDVAAQDRELRRALAKASLRSNWSAAERNAPLSPSEIDAEIQIVRKRRAPRKNR